jgi:hypothetical protein
MRKAFSRPFGREIAPLELLAGALGDKKEGYIRNSSRSVICW